ncbi:MAG TPA: tetratricopeptide repeat protein [Gemmatimonadales bacterium]|nr:tetratricopeptide repeat protein [Gemmatimonadales bacterium]
MAIASNPGDDTDERSAERCLDEGRRHDLAGRMDKAVECYAAAIDSAAGGPSSRVRAEAFRRLGVLHHRKAEPEAARECCRRSLDAAVAAELPDLAAEALNALGGFAFEHGKLAEARASFVRALELAAGDVSVIGKVEENLGIIDSAQGHWESALMHYGRALDACERAHDTRGCAIAYHNLGMLHADQRQWQQADAHYRDCQRLAQAVADVHLTALAALNRAEVQAALGQYAGARTLVERALRAFTRLGARRDLAGAHRLAGVVSRALDQPTLAESHLRSAVEVARAADCPLAEADAWRDLAELYRERGRVKEAQSFLLEARRTYQMLGAQHEVADMDERMLACQVA